MSGRTWLYLLLSCVFYICGSSTKAIAMKNIEASKVQKLSFLPNVWQFFIDLIVLSVVFSPMQYAGFGLLMGFYALDVLYSIIKEKLEQQ